ncbi:hypothetical protein GQ600_9239 [Phytophthora cactorum]|nr:hypothetical protein GQ600_9239 [Phytophthora cactorum]
MAGATTKKASETSTAAAAAEAALAAEALEREVAAAALKAQQAVEDEPARGKKQQEQDELDVVAVGAVAHLVEPKEPVELKQEEKEAANNSGEQQETEESPFVALAQTRKDSIAQELENKHERAEPCSTSGNGENIGYLDTTLSSIKRTEATLDQHKNHIAGVKIAHAEQRAIAAKASPQKDETNVGDDLTESNTSAKPCFDVVPKPPIIFTEYDIGGIYEQVVTVGRSGIDRNARSSGSAQMVVPLMARREPPELTLPLVVRAQNTLVGGRSVTSLVCKNLGGKGRFWLMNEPTWSRLEHLQIASNGLNPTRSAVEMLGGEYTLEATMDIGPFRMTPNDIELEKGESIVGRGCQVDIAATHVNDAPIDTTIAEMGPLDRLFFPEEYSLTPCSTHHPDGGKDKAMVLSLSSERTPPYRITPESGVFALSSSKEFTIEFLPVEARTYACQATLMIKDIPACSMPGPGQMAHLKAAFQTQEDPTQSPRDAAKKQQENYEMRCQGFSPTTRTWETWQLHDHSNSQRFLDTCELEPLGQQRIDLTFMPHCTGSFSLSVPCRIVTPNDANNPKAPRFERWLLLEGRVTGAEIEIVTPEIDFGLVLVGASAESFITIRNPSPSVTTHWRFLHLEGSTSSENPAQSSLGSKLRRSSSKESVVSRHSVISSSSGNETERSSIFTSRDILPRATVAFAPENGELAPGESFTVKATCMAGSLPERFRGLFSCQAAPEQKFFGSNTKGACAAVSARAEIQCPNVFLSTTRLPLGTTYMGVEIHRTIELVNVSNLETAFKFVEPEGVSRAYTITFSPKQGTIHSKERLVVTLNYTPRQVGRFTVILACSVRGLPAPLGFEVASNHKGLVLSYDLVQAPQQSGIEARTTDTSTLTLPKSPKEIAMERGIPLSDCDLEPETNPLSSVPKLVFGDSIPLGKRQVLSLLIRNFSGIEALVDLEAKKFPAAAVGGNGSLSRQDCADFLPFRKRRLQVTTAMVQDKLAKSRLSDAKDDGNRYQSEKGRAYLRQRAENIEDRQILREGRGVAFQLSPARVHIPPWEQVVVRVTCFNNMPVITRTLRVVNRGPQRARLKWKLVENGREDQLVTVTLRVDFGSRLQLRVSPCDDFNSRAALPFTVEPQSAMVPAFSTTPFRITFDPPKEDVGAPRALLLADAHWYDTSVEDSLHSDSTSTISTSVTVPGDGRLLQPRWQNNNSPTHAAGKAFTAVRMANAMVRKPGPVIGSTPASSFSPKCLRVLLSADVIEPELFIDKPRELQQLQPPLSPMSARNTTRKSSSAPTVSLPRPLTPYHIKFTTWSTLMSTSAAQHLFHRRELFLVNRLGSRVTFRLECDGPFAVAHADSLAPRHPLSMADLPAAHRRSSAQGESYMFMLPPQMSVRIDLRFLPSASLLTDFLTSATLNTKSKPPLQQPLHIQLDGELRVKFATKSVQTIRLAAVVLRPAIVVSPSVFFFGRVHLSASRFVVLRLANPTVVPAIFSIQHVPRPKPVSRAQQQEMSQHHAHLTDEPGVFTFAKLSVHAPLELQVEFHPRESGRRYRSRFRFNVEHGRDFEVALEGTGHLDEVDNPRDGERPLVRVRELEHSYHIFRGT